MIWATGDCHGNFERFRPEYFPEQAQMTKDDVVVVTGDFGGIWFGDARDDEALGCLESLPFTLAFVDGNHENYDALASYPAEKWQGGKIHRIRPHVLHLMRGQIYELEGYRFFTMGGAKSHDIEDGILDPDDPNFGRKFLMLQRRPRSSPTAPPPASPSRGPVTTRRIGSRTSCKRYGKEQNTTTGCSAIITTTEPLMKSTSFCGSRSCGSSEASQSREKHGGVTVLFSALSVDQAHCARK